MQFKDYYQIMGVARDAIQDEIKRAYRKLARKYHPDVSKEADAEARFKELGEAYEVLKDAEKRAAYDQLGPTIKGDRNFVLRRMGTRALNLVGAVLLTVMQRATVIFSHHCLAKSFAAVEQVVLPPMQKVRIITLRY